MRVRSLGWKDPLEKEMETHSGVLIWRIPRTEEPGVGYSPIHGVEKSRTDQTADTHHVVRFVCLGAEC